jgi:hypothetical protein
MTITEIVGAVYLLLGVIIAFTASRKRSKGDGGSWLTPIGDLASLNAFTFMLFVAMWPLWGSLLLVFRKKVDKEGSQRNE